MAINKNFVIKNGVEVNTNLLVGDSTLNKVGIATTVPGYTLHIGVGGGARGGIGATDITVTGIATIGVANSNSGALSVTGISTFEGLIDANGGVSARTAAVQDLTSGRVVLAGTGGELEDSANLTFDGSTLTVSGDLDPTNVSIGGTLQVAGVSTFLSGVIVSGIGTFENDVDFKGTSADITFDQSANSLIFDDDAAAKFGTDSDFTVKHSGSNANIENTTGDLVIRTLGSGDDIFIDSKDDVNIRVNETQNAITCIGGGEVELYHGNTKIFQTTGIGITVGLSTIQHNGNAAFAGIVTTGGVIDANGGANIAGGLVANSAQISDLTDNRVVIAGSSGELEDDGNLTFDGAMLKVGTAATVAVNGNAAFAGIVTVGGNLNVTGDYSVDEISARNLILTGIATIPTLGVTGLGTFEKLTVGTGVTLQEHGGASFAGITTINGAAVLGSSLAVAGVTSLGGNVSLGNASSDTITATARFSSDLIPATDATHDLGDTTREWQDLFLNGTAHIDNINAGVATVTSNVNIAGVTTTGENLGGFKRLVGAASSTVVSIAVTVAAKTADHRYYGQGSDNGYWLDGVQSPFVTLVPGKLYFFDQSNSTNSGHPLLFYLEQDKANGYTTEVVTVGTPGSSGAYTKIGIGTGTNENNHPAILHYQCSSHALMGNAVATQSNSVNLPDSVVTTVRGNLMPGTDSSYDIGASGTRFTNIYGDTLYGDGSNLTNLPTQVSIGNNADNRVITGGSGVNLNGEANLTFDGSTLGITGSIDLSADIDVDGTANLDILDVDGASNFGADVVFAGASANITFDQSEDDLIFDDNAKAIFGAGSDLQIYHQGSHSYIQDAGTGSLILVGNNVTMQNAAQSENMFSATQDGSIDLYHNGVKQVETTADGILVGSLSTVARNGNAAFAGITTIGTLLDVNGRIDGAGGANFSGIVTQAAAYITKLANSAGSSGSANEVPVANGSGGWSWAPVNTAGASDIQGITIQEEGSNVGTAGSISTINFVGNDVTADATANQGICTITVDSNIAGINTLTQSYFHDQHIVGVVSFISSDQEAVFNVGTAATVYKNGNIRTTGITSIRGGLVVGDTTDKITNGGVLVATSAGVGVGSIATNGNAAFAGIVTAGSGFNIGIQSAGIVIAKNVGISTLNFVGSGNSVTYFAATNTLDVSIAGSSGGGGGGVSETSTSVSSTSATSCGSFAKASKRSASVLAQITQGSAYQVGRYLVIHDGTTTTTIEESAVATGSMLGTFEGVINGNDVEFRVTMSSSSSATVITKIDSISS